MNYLRSYSPYIFFILCIHLLLSDVEPASKQLVGGHLTTANTNGKTMQKDVIIGPETSVDRSKTLEQKHDMKHGEQKRVELSKRDANIKIDVVIDGINPKAKDKLQVPSGRVSPTQRLLKLNLNGIDQPGEVTEVSNPISKDTAGKQQECNKKSAVSNNGAIPLNIIGLFAMTGIYRAGMSYLGAALLAAKHINQDENILKGYRLVINAYDTSCNESLGLEAFYKEVYNPNRTSIMVLGETCSHVTEATSQVSHLWGLVQVSYSALSPHLSDKKIFPMFFRVMTPEQNLTIARVTLFKKVGWKRVHIIYQNFKLFSTLDEYMRKDLKAAGIQVVSAEMFTNDPYQSVANLRSNDARIIIASMYADKARRVMCAAYNLEREASENGKQPWYKRVVWILPSFFDRFWPSNPDPMVNCTAAQIQEVIGDYFTMGSRVYSTAQNYTPYNGRIKLEDFQGNRLYKEVSKEIPSKFRPLYQLNSTFHVDGSLYGQHRAPQAYDAVWAIAMALNNTLTHLIESGDCRRLEDFSYRNHDFSQLLLESMYSLKFPALSGPISFNKTCYRTPGVIISRYHNDGSSNFTSLGECEMNLTHEHCYLNTSKIVWKGKYPVDGIQTKNRILRIEDRIVYVFCALACLGIIMSACLLVFNIAKKDHRIIKMSSPRLNNVILVGCMLAYSTVIVVDIDGAGSETMCVLRTFTVVLSFSLSFGALFAKTWRVYEIFTAGHKVLNTRMLRDSSLFIIVGVLVLVNSAILVGWVVASPQKGTLVNISRTPGVENSDIEYNDQFQRCESQYRLHFTWALVAIQGVVILLGTFLAIQTRKVSFPELNDSKWIALCIYNVVVLSPIGVVVVMATEDKPEINYALESTMLLLVTTMTLCLIFVPKIVAYRNHNRRNSSQLDISLKLRQVNDLFSLFVLEGGSMKRKGSDAFRHSQGSICCEASQQTDDVEVVSSQIRLPLTKSQSLTTRRKCHMKGVSCETNRDSKRRRHDDIDITTELDFDHIECQTKQDLDPERVEPEVCCGKVQSHLPRSNSDSNVLDAAKLYKKAKNISFAVGDTPVRASERRQNNLGDPGEKREHSSYAEDRPEDSAGLVLDKIKVKADMKVSSKFGFKASWKEGRGHFSNVEQISELLNRLKETMETGSAKV